jgi:hypothetical protein
VGKLLAKAGLEVRWYDSGLIWHPATGIGWYDVKAGTTPYNQDYFEKYRKYSQTELGRKLNSARLDFVARHYRGALCDVGIGCGQFIETRRRDRKQNTYGWDVNPAGMAWLEERNLLVDPYLVKFPAITLWDVLEHIPHFIPLLDNAKEWVFVSLPVFSCREHIEDSKHFRKDEHVWYFTANGLIWLFDQLGFDLAEHNHMETELGREDIDSFAFKRRIIEEAPKGRVESYSIGGCE